MRIRIFFLFLCTGISLSSCESGSESLSSRNVRQFLEEITGNTPPDSMLERAYISDSLLSGKSPLIHGLYRKYFQELRDSLAGCKVLACADLEEMKSQRPDAHLLSQTHSDTILVAEIGCGENVLYRYFRMHHGQIRNLVPVSNGDKIKGWSL